MKFPYCTMTSRSARILLSEQEKSVLLNRIARVISRVESSTKPVGLAYRNVRLVVDAKERVIKIMSEHEFSRLHPMMAALTISTESTKAA
ncbi:MAG: hypothetical protein U0796_18945 [Gemmatales bacterium]